LRASVHDSIGFSRLRSASRRGTRARGSVGGYVGVEPSGDTFNSIELEPEPTAQFNPMVNSGAIANTALLHARYGNATIDCILDRLSTLADAPYDR
jgi:glutaminase